MSEQTHLYNYINYNAANYVYCSSNYKCQYWWQDYRERCHKSLMNIQYDDITYENVKKVVIDAKVNKQSTYPFTVINSLNYIFEFINMCLDHTNKYNDFYGFNNEKYMIIYKMMLVLFEIGSKYYNMSASKILKDYNQPNIWRSCNPWDSYFSTSPYKGLFYNFHKKVNNSSLQLEIAKLLIETDFILDEYKAVFAGNKSVENKIMVGVNDMSAAKGHILRQWVLECPYVVYNREANVYIGNMLENESVKLEDDEKQYIRKCLSV